MTFKKSIIIYGLAMALLMGLLKFFEYRFFVRDMTLELYLGLVAVVFIALGAWIGWRLTHKKTVTAVSIDSFSLDADELKRLGITKREYEVLENIALGLSNQEIADKLFVSTSTIKTHLSSLFLKLDARRRTQAIQKAKELRILP
ncbi:MAG: LuxR C-terminal-related transcriptional regulator [Pyrinomonadaceae bacterium]